MWGLSFCHRGAISSNFHSFYMYFLRYESKQFVVLSLSDHRRPFLHCFFFLVCVLQLVRRSQQVLSTVHLNLFKPFLFLLWF